LRLNITIHKNEKQLQLESTLNEYFFVAQTRNYIINSPFRMVIVQLYKDEGIIVVGEIESGCCKVGDECVIMPNKTRVKISNIYHKDREIDSCVYGQIVRLKLENIEKEKICPGFILCKAKQKPCGFGRIFKAQVLIIDHKSEIQQGYSAVLHIHAAVVKVQLQKLLASIDFKTSKQIRQNPKSIKHDQAAIAKFELSQPDQVICMELYEDSPRLGRFVLRDNDGIVSVGKVITIIA